MCDWWLFHIEKKADQYLKDCGYEHDVLPENYTKEKPKDLDSLKKNLLIVQDLIEGESEELDNFVDETTLEVYEMLEKLLHEIEFVLQRKWTKMNLEVEYTEEDIESLKKDYDYLMKVKEMDLELKEKRKQKVREKEPLRISEVVPVSGLVMARFHIFRAECQTSLLVWEKKMSGSKIVQASRSTWRMAVFENGQQTHEKPNLFEFCGSTDELSLADSISGSFGFDDDEEEVTPTWTKNQEPSFLPEGWREIDQTSSEAPAKDCEDDSRPRKSAASWKKIDPSPVRSPTFSPQTISKNLSRKSCQFSPTTGPTTSQLTIPSPPSQKSISQKSLSTLRKGSLSSSEPFANHRQANKGPALSLSTSPQQRKSFLSSHSSSPSSPSFTPSSPSFAPSSPSCLSLHRSDALAIPNKNPRNKSTLPDKQKRKREKEKKERDKGKREENEERGNF